MNPSDSTSLIEDFLADRLSDKDKLAVEDRIKSDTAFAEEVEIQKNILLSIERAANEDLRNTIEGIQNKLGKEGFFDSTEGPVHEGKILKLSFSRIASIAAAIAVLIMATWWFLRPAPAPAPEFRFADHYIPAEDLLSSKLSESGFTSSASDSILQLGIDAYNAEDDETSLKLLEQYKELEDPSSFLFPFADFYRAQIFLKNKEYGSAVKILQKLNQENDFELKSQVKWYLALGLLGENKIEEAKSILLELKNDNQTFNKVEGILKLL